MEGCNDFRRGVGVGENADVKSACADAVRAARDGLGGAVPRAAFVTATVDHDAAQVFTAFQKELGDVPLHGVTTSLGVLAPTGVYNRGTAPSAVMLFGGDAGVARGTLRLRRHAERARWWRG